MKLSLLVSVFVSVATLSANAAKVNVSEERKNALFLNAAIWRDVENISAQKAVPNMVEAAGIPINGTL